MTTYVTYKRVSTDKQGIKGLGIEGQEMQINDYLKTHTNSVINNFAEVCSGSKKGLKPELKKALKLCQETGATLLVAKLDRMTRSLDDLYAIRSSGVRFVSADNPQAGNLLVNILISIGEDELERISSRTKQALAALKITKITKKGKRIEKLGTPANLTYEGRVKGANTINEIKKEKADVFAHKVAPIIFQLQLKNYTIGNIAKVLNTGNFPTATGKIGVWDFCKVKNVLNRMDKSTSVFMEAV